MTCFKSLFLSSILALTFVGCSKSVDDMNEGLSNQEKKDLKSRKLDDTLEVTSFKIEAEDDIREDGSADSNIIKKYYALQVCLSDRQISKDLANRKIFIDGEEKTLDTKGCAYWDHEIDFDYKKVSRCKVFQKNIQVGSKKKTFKYTIDYITSKISDLDKSRGCLTRTVSKNEALEKGTLFLDDVDLYYVKNLTKMRSDIRWINHQTKIKSCIKARVSGSDVSNAKIILTAKNLETGEVSVGKNPNLTTNANGCFATDIESRFEQYKYSHWMPVEIDIKIVSGPLAGTSVGRTVYINPWEPYRTVYGVGEHGRVPTEIDFKSEYARLHLDGVMYIQIGNDTKKMTVNDYLGLTISKTYQVVLNPYVDREHRYSPSIKSPIERINHNGKFKLSMVVLAPKEGDMEIDKGNFTDFEYITGVEKEVEIKNGLINAVVNIPFKMVDLPRLAVRTMSIFKIEAVGDSGLQSSVVTGFFKARIPWIKTNVLQTKYVNIPKYIDTAWSHVGHLSRQKKMTVEAIDEVCSKLNGSEEDDCLKGAEEIKNSGINESTMAYKQFIDKMFLKLEDQTNKMNAPAAQKITAKEIFVNHLNNKMDNLKQYNLKEFAQKEGIRISKNDFNEIFPENKTEVKLSKEVVESLCSKTFKQYERPSAFWGDPKNDYRDDCIENPLKYFGFGAYRHVKKVEKIGDSYANGFSMGVGENFSVNDSETQNYTESTGRFVSLDVGVKFDKLIEKVPVIGPVISSFVGAGVKTGTNRNWVWSDTESIGFNRQENAGTSKNFGVEKFVVDLDVRTEKCLLIHSIPFVDKELARERRMEEYYRTRRLARQRSGVALDETYVERSGDYLNPVKDLKKQYYICDNELDVERYTESWYFVQSNIDSSIGRDYDGVKERRLLKSFRGKESYLTFRNALRDLPNNSLVTDNIGHGTPEEVLLHSWGHLLGNSIPKTEARKFLLDHMEGSFPGTIQGNGTIKAERSDDADKF